MQLRVYRNGGAGRGRLCAFCMSFRCTEMAWEEPGGMLQGCASGLAAVAATVSRKREQQDSSHEY